MKWTSLIIIWMVLIVPAHAASSKFLHHLPDAYPDHVDKVALHYIACKDGTRLPIGSTIPIFDFFIGKLYHVDHSYGNISHKDLKRDRFESLFRKMYGNSPQEVEKNLVTIYWMPKVFGTRFPLRVTKINGVAEKLEAVSSELEQLPPTYFKYLEKPAANYYWRNVLGERYLSLHSFGIAVDINVDYSNYWLWDFLKLKRPVSDLRYHTIQYQNRIPKKIVELFAKHGFYWGGNWYYYDTMHFEYRPELFV